MSHKIYWVRNTSSRAVEADRTIKLNADADRPRRSAQFALSNWVQLRYLMIALGRLIRVSSSLSRYCRVADLRCNGLWSDTAVSIAVIPILADAVEVKKGSGSIAHWSIDFIRLNGWLRRCFTQLITPLDIDGIGQTWEDSNIGYPQLWGCRALLNVTAGGRSTVWAVRTVRSASDGKRTGVGP